MKNNSNIFTILLFFILAGVFNFYINESISEESGSNGQSAVLQQNEIIKERTQSLNTVDPCPEGYSLSKTSGKCEEIKEIPNISNTSEITNEDTNIDTLFKSALDASKAGRYQEAIEFYDKILDIDPNIAVVLSNKGNSLSKLGKNIEALESYDKALAIDPNYTKALQNKGSILFELGKHQEAIEYFDKALAIDPNDTTALLNKGGTLGELDRPQEALVFLDKALAIDPNDTTALLNKGGILVELDRPQEALVFLDKALAIDPNDETALFNKGSALLNLGRYQEALEYYDKALAIDPNDEQTLKNKGNTLANLGRYQEALEYYDKALAIDPNYKKAIDAKEQVLSLLKENKAGFIQTNPSQSGSKQSTSFQNADPCPSGFALSQSSGKCETKQGSAIQQQQQSPSLTDNTTVVNLLRAAANTLSLERYQETIENIDKALAFDPNNKKALNLKGFALFKLERYQEALEYYDKALAIDSNDKFSLSYKGLALNNLERYQEAIKYYDKALAIDPSYDTALAGKGISLTNLGLYQEGIVFLDKALAIDPDDKDALQTKKKVLEHLKDNNDNGSAFITYSNKGQDLVSYRIPNDWKQSKQTLSGDRDHIAVFNHKEAVGSNLDLQITVYMAVEFEFKGKKYDGSNTNLKETAELALELLKSEYNDIEITNVNTMKIDGYDAAVFSATGTDKSGSNKGFETSIKMGITISDEAIYIFRYESNNVQAFQQHLSDFESILKSVDFKPGGQGFGGFGDQSQGIGEDDNSNG